MLTVANIMQGLGEVDIPRVHKRKRENWSWTSPAIGHIKVDIDGSFLWGSCTEGIDGVFRDSKCKVLLQLCKVVRVDSAVHAELLVVWEGILVAATSRWASCHSFRFESDSKLVVM